MRTVLALLIALGIVLAPQSIKPCDTDRNCAIVHDATNGLPYELADGGK